MNSRNARQIERSDWLSDEACLKSQWSPEQIAAEVPISHETIYRHVYAELAKIHGLLNNQPRKRLGHKISYEVFTKSFNPVALRALI